MVLVGEKPEPEVEAVITIPNFGDQDKLVLVEIDFGAGAEVWFFLSRINALTISFSSTTSDETAGVEEFVLTLETMALLRD
ncbi:hypothetical protein Tco_1344872 [Tanacetum coccineum]